MANYPENTYAPSGYPPQPYPPQMEMQAPPGVQMGDPISALAPINKFVIKQKFSLLEAATNAAGCGCCEERNKYNIYDGSTGSHLFKVQEESGCCMRCCCNPAHALTLNVFDAATDNQVAIIDRPFKWGCCFSWLECCLDEATLYRGNSVEGERMGVTKQPHCGGQCVPTMFAYNANFPDGDGAKDEGSFAKITGPTCCFGGCTELCCDQDFHVTDQNGDVGMIVKEKPEGAMEFLKEAANDADMFSLTLQKDISADDKMVLLSSLLLTDYLFFEEGGMIQCDDGLTIVCCFMYCQGCFIPCKFKLCGGDSDQ